MTAALLALVLVPFSLFASGLAAYHAGQAHRAKEQAARARDLMGRAAGSIGRCLATIDRSDTSEGVCCCGDPVGVHGYHSGHGPVDAGDYAAAGVVLEARAVLNELLEADLP